MGNETTDIFFDKKINDYRTLNFYHDKIQNIEIKNLLYLLQTIPYGTSTTEIKDNPLRRN